MQKISPIFTATKFILFQNKPSAHEKFLFLFSKTESVFFDEIVENVILLKPFKNFSRILLDQHSVFISSASGRYINFNFR